MKVFYISQRPNQMNDTKPIKGELFSYIVESSKPGKDPYRVDLTQNRGRGMCSCDDHHFRGRRCKHIRKSLNHFYENNLTKFLAEFQDGTPEDVKQAVSHLFEWNAHEMPPR